MLSKKDAKGRIYRGGRPEIDDILELKSKGIRSIVNLQKEDGKTIHKEFIEELGLKFFHIPVRDHYAPTIEQIEEFIDITCNENNVPLYVHCLAGLERTGTMVACYRIYSGWYCEDAINYNEIEVDWPLLEPQKNVIREYWKKLRK